MSTNLDAMIKRKELVRQGTDEADAQAEQILEQVQQNGGLTTEEVYALQAF
jgi:uncharacterized coiled-coil DUF342 family protein